MKNILISVWPFLKKNGLVILTLSISMFTLFAYIKQATLLSKQTHLLSSQTKALIEQNKATAWPYLSVDIVGWEYHYNSQTRVKQYSIQINNTGNGPAIVENMVMKMNGIEIESWNELFDKMDIPENIDKRARTSSKLSKKVIPPGTSRIVINLDQNLQLADHIYDRLKEVEISICYKSTFGDHWIVTQKGLQISNDAATYTEPLDECQLKGTKYFAD